MAAPALTPAVQRSNRHLPWRRKAVSSAATSGSATDAKPSSRNAVKIVSSEWLFAMVFLASSHHLPDATTCRPLQEV